MRPGPETLAVLSAHELRRRRARTMRSIYSSRTVLGCGKRLIGTSVTVTKRGDGIGFTGVARCGSVHVCPYCAAAITEERAQELIEACRAWIAAGNTVAMLTLTFSHQADEALCDLLSALKDAFATLKAHRDYKDARRDLHIAGSVNAKEVTVGAVNGWHPHNHQLEFIRGKPSAAELETYRSAVLRTWQGACESAGLGRPSDERGVDLAIGKTVSERLAAYVAKFGAAPEHAGWGAERELTKCHQKRAKSTGKAGVRFHPFALLDEYDRTEDEQLRQWFLEYATAFKGQRQLVWSRGLREIIAALPKPTENTVVPAQPVLEDEEFIAEISAADWSLLVRLHLVEAMQVALERTPAPYVIAAFIAQARKQHAKSLYLRDVGHRVDAMERMAI